MSHPLWILSHQPGAIEKALYTLQEEWVCQGLAGTHKQAERQSRAAGQACNVFQVDGRLKCHPQGWGPQYMQEASHRACMAQIRHLVHPMPTVTHRAHGPPGLICPVGTEDCKTPVSPISQRQYQVTLGQMRPWWDLLIIRQSSAACKELLLT